MVRWSLSLKSRIYEIVFYVWYLVQEFSGDTGVRPTFGRSTPNGERETADRGFLPSRSTIRADLVFGCHRREHADSCGNRACSQEAADNRKQIHRRCNGCTWWGQSTGVCDTIIIGAKRRAAAHFWTTTSQASCHTFTPHFDWSIERGISPPRSEGHRFPLRISSAWRSGHSDGWFPCLAQCSASHWPFVCNHHCCWNTSAVRHNSSIRRRQWPHVAASHELVAPIVIQPSSSKLYYAALKNYQLPLMKQLPSDCSKFYAIIKQEVLASMEATLKRAEASTDEKTVWWHSTTK